MAAPKGNSYWKLASNWKNGADAKYTPESLWGKALEYFEWIEKNPLKEEKVFGTGKRMKVNKMRAMTITSFCVFAQISKQTFDKYNKDEAYITITTRVKSIIFSQKFEGAAAGLLESNIIARELGLADKQEVDHTSMGDKVEFKGFSFLPFTPEANGSSEK